MPRPDPQSLILSTLCPLVLVCAACEKKPAEIRIDGEMPRQVFTIRPVSLPTARVLDDKGEPLEKQPRVMIESQAPEVAMIQDQQLLPLANGEAKIRYHLPQTNLQVLRTLTVNLVDRIELGCPEQGCQVASGDKTAMSVKFLNAGSPAENVIASWQSSNPASVLVDDQGGVEAKSPGESEISVQLGSLNAKISVQVLGRSEPDQIKLRCKQENVDIFDAAQSCVVRMGSSGELDLSASASGDPVVVPALDWSAEDPTVAKVTQSEGARVEGLKLGTTTVVGKRGDAQASLAIKVIPPTCSDSDVESFRETLGPGRMISGECRMVGAEDCFFHYADRKKPSAEQMNEASRRCCCQVTLDVNGRQTVYR